MRLTDINMTDAITSVLASVAVTPNNMLARKRVKPDRRNSLSKSRTCENQECESGADEVSHGASVVCDLAVTIAKRSSRRKRKRGEVELVLVLEIPSRSDN